MIGGLVKTLGGFLVGAVKDRLTNAQEARKLKHTEKLKKIDLRTAEVENRARLMRDESTNNSNYAMAAMRMPGMEFGRNLLLVVILLPLAAAVIHAPWGDRAWVAMQAAPTEYWALLGAAAALYFAAPKLRDWRLTK